MPLSNWAYGTGHRDGVAFESQWEQLEWLRERRLPHEPVCRAPRDDRGGRANAAASGKRRRAELDYEIDGIVIKVDSLEQQSRLGALHERPRWARAFKWAPMTAQTTLREDRDPRRPDRCPQSVGHPRARRGRRRHRLARDAPQRGGHQPQADSRGRSRDRAACGRRDPAGRRACRRASEGDEGVPDAEPLPPLRRGGGEARGRGDAPLSRTAPALREGSRR